MAQQASLDVKGLKCPMPMLRAKKALAHLESGDELTVYATDPGVQEDFAAFCRHTGHVLLQSTANEDDSFTLILRHK